MEIAEDLQLILFHFIKQKIYNKFYNGVTDKSTYPNDRYFKRTYLDEVS